MKERTKEYASSMAEKAKGASKAADSAKETVKDVGGEGQGHRAWGLG